MIPYEPLMLNCPLPTLGPSSIAFPPPSASWRTCTEAAMSRSNDALMAGHHNCACELYGRAPSSTSPASCLGVVSLSSPSLSPAIFASHWVLVRLQESKAPAISSSVEPGL